MPREAASKEVHKDVSQGLEIISSRLLSTQMGVDGHVSSCSTQTLPLSIRDMLLRLWISVLLGHTKIDYVYDVGSLGHGSTDEEVVWLDVSVDEVLLVNGLYTCDHLLGCHDHSLDGELPAAHVKEVFQ